MRWFLLFSFLLIGIIVFPQVSAGDDQSICIGETTELEGSGFWTYTYTWTSVPNDPTISNPNILTPTVQPGETTVYTLEGRDVSNTNLVQNGDFEDGNTGFTSSYIFSPGPNGLQPEGTYAITNDANYNHNNFFCDNDHTTGNGYFMAINGSQQTNVVVWSTTVFGVSQNSEYEFSTWISSLVSSSPAILQFRINGELLGDPFTASSVTCEWHQFFEQWNSGTNNSAVISIVNQNTAGSGNDFSLDDINFSKVNYYYDDCTVDVNPIPTSTFDIPTEICSADTAIITYTGTASVTDLYDWDFDGATIISGSGQGPYKLQWSSSGLHNVSLSVVGACSSDTTSSIIVVHYSPSNSLTADETVIPYGTTTFLHAAFNGNPGPFNFVWHPDDQLQDPTSQDPETILMEQTTLFTFTVTDESSNCQSEDTITIKVTGGPLTILSLLANPDTICFGENTEIAIDIAGGSGNYVSTWTSDPPGFNHTGSETSITVNPESSTTYFVEVSDGFTILPQESILVVVYQQIELIVQPSDTLIEEGQTAIFQVNANNLTNFQWQESTDNGLSWTTIIDDATYSGAQTSILTISNANVNMSSFLYRCLLEGKCDPLTSETALLTIISSPDFIVQLEDLDVCQADAFSIPCYFENFIEIDSFSLTFTFNPSLLQFEGLENINSELETIIVNPSNGSVNLSWQSETGITVGNNNLFDLVFISLEGGETSIDWLNTSLVRNSYGFYPELILSSSNINITWLAKAPDYVFATPDSLNLIDEIDIELEASGGIGDELLWSLNSCNDSIIGEGSPFYIFRPEETTTYFVSWTNECGVSECGEVTVKITEDLNFAIPNAFSPNGDGINDEFGVISLNDLAFFELMIFNRWGQLIFTSESQYEKWDGLIKGERAPMGTYVWKVRYQYRIEGEGNELHQETGVLTLIL